MSSQIKSKNITWHHGKLTPEERQENWAKKEPSFGSRAFPPPVNPPSPAKWSWP
jgi:hypothetical protein